MAAAKAKFSLTRKRQPAPGRTPRDFVDGNEAFMMKTFRIPTRLAHKLKVYSARHRQTDTQVIVSLIEQLLENEEAA